MRQLARRVTNLSKGIMRSCGQCGAPVRRPPSKANQTKVSFCSRDCRYLHQAGAKNPNWRGGLKDRRCKNCGEPFKSYCKPDRNNRVEYCSPVCAGASRRLHGSEAEKRRASGRARYRYEKAARKRGTHTAEEWAACKRKHNFRCVLCGKRKSLTKDHIRPVSRGGSDAIKNIQPACRPCNIKKGNR